MNGDRPVGEREKKALLILVGAFLLYLIGVHWWMADRAWDEAVEAAGRRAVVAAPRLPPNCGIVLKTVVCVSIDLAGPR